MQPQQQHLQRSHCNTVTYNGASSPKLLQRIRTVPLGLGSIKPVNCCSAQCPDSCCSAHSALGTLLY
jgi:hypothetical protein